MSNRYPWPYLAPVTVLEVIQRSTEFLARKGVESPRLQVELLLGHALHLPRLRLYLDFERKLNDVELEQVRALVRRRGNREPLQHIVGTTSFCGLEIGVNRDVLVPRPETEVLAEQAWTFLQSRLNEGLTAPAVLDFGTGSGCVALALAWKVPSARVWALDTSAVALAKARENATRLRFHDQIHFAESQGFVAVPPTQQFDLIVSNPPYIPSAEIKELAPEVRDHDPLLALDGGPDGLDLFRQLASDASAFLAPRGQLMCEFGDNQAEAVQELFRKAFWEVRRIVSDLSGRPRILVAQRRES
ncbi:MAG: peptide chain release factor N(5)-glutamine methyltransferase [Verrucomicrobiota bacterium]